jgi:hypothetical protein
MPTVLTSDLLHSPFTCRRCRRVLVKSDALIDPPPLGPLPEIAHIANWYRWASEIPRIGALPLAEKERRTEPVHSPLWPLLEFAGGKRAPKLVNIEREQLAGTRIQVFTCGLPLSQNDPMPEDQEPVPPRENVIRILAMYRQYRRHLKKRMSRGERRLLRDFLRLYADRWDDSVRIPTTECSQEVKACAFGLLLFRFTMEGWSSLHPGICQRAPSILGGCDCLAVLQRTSPLRAQRTGSLRCSSAKLDWLEDRLVLERIRSVFEDAVCFAREMVRTGYYFLVDVYDFHLHFPYGVGRRDEKGRLQLWSLKLAVDTSDYRRVQAAWRMALTPRIIYKESRVASESRNFSDATALPELPDQR